MHLVDSEVLYVGYSRWNWRRLDGHADRVWFRDVQDVKVEHWPNVETARVREMQLIAALWPTYNVDRGPDPDVALLILDELAAREWDDDDATGEWFLEGWRDGVMVDPWYFSNSVIRPLGAALGHSMWGGDELPKWYGRHLESA